MDHRVRLRVRLRLCRCGHGGDGLLRFRLRFLLRWRLWLLRLLLRLLRLWLRLLLRCEVPNALLPQLRRGRGGGRLRRGEEARSARGGCWLRCAGRAAGAAATAGGPVAVPLEEFRRRCGCHLALGQKLAL